MSKGVMTLGLAAVGLAASVGAEAPTGPCTTLYLDSPGAVEGLLTKRFGWGNTRTFEVSARLRISLPEGSAVEGYSIAVEHTEWPLEIVDLTTEPLNQIASTGFVKTEIIRNGSRRGFISATVPCEENCSLPSGDITLAKIEYLVNFGADVVVNDERIGRIWYQDGLQGSGQPVSNLLTVNGDRVAACTESLDVKARIEDPEFMRGDSNDDGVLDISDAVTVLRSQFHGDAVVHCEDAGDANDDGRLDISDAIYIFGYLFRGGPPPISPFPNPGRDFSGDELGCFPEEAG